MIAVIFEVVCHSEKESEYLAIADKLKPLLQTMDGFISIERFRSITQPEKMLSLSFWRDEQSVKQWRDLMEHRLAQRSGRNGVFSDYQLRVAHVLRDYGLQDREEAPKDSSRFHCPKTNIEEH